MYEAPFRSALATEERMWSMKRKRTLRSGLLEMGMPSQTT